MKTRYRLELTRKNGKLCSVNHFDSLEEAERIGFNHTTNENHFGNYIPKKDERLFTVWEVKR